MRFPAPTAFGLFATLVAMPVLAQSPAPVGVPECDSFLADYDRCLNTNVPEVSRAQLAASITQLRDSWRQAAQNPQSRTMLAPQCTQMRQQMAQTMSAYNCRF